MNRCNMCEEEAVIVKVIDIAGPGLIKIKGEWQDHSEYQTYDLCEECSGCGEWLAYLDARPTISH